MLQKSRKTKLVTGQKMCRILFGILLFCVFCISQGKPVQKAEAAGATISVTSKNRSAMEGDTVYVVITVSSSENIKGFEGYFSYDNSVLQFVTGGSVVHGNDDEFQISDMDRSESAAKIKYSVKFRARKKGQTTISLQQPYNVIADDGSSTKMSVSYSELEVVVSSLEETEKKEAAKKKSAQAVPSPGKASEQKKEAAKKKQTKTTEKPDASASPDKAEKGSEKTKQEAAEKAAKSQPAITLTELKDENLIPAGFSEIETEIDGKKVTAYALNGEEESPYLLFYGIEPDKEDAIEKFYLYDRESGMWMPYESIRSLYRNMNEKDLVGDSSQRTIQSLHYVIGIMAVFCALMILLAIAFRIRYSDRNKD